MEEQGKKISLPEIIIMLMIVGGADALEAVTGLAAGIPIIGQILVFGNWFVDIFVLAIVQFWLIMKEGIGFQKQVIALTGNLIEFIPLLDILPIRTFTLIIAIYLINHPRVAAVAGNIKGKIGAGATESSSVK